MSSEKLSYPVMVDFPINDLLFLRDPQQSALGQRIVREGSLMISEMGLEEFTFRKLAFRLKTNESSIYRYFESKHRLLLYLIQYYWYWMDFELTQHLKNVSDVRKKIDVLIDLLMLRSPSATSVIVNLDMRVIHGIVIREASKAYLTNHVNEDNSRQFFKPYKQFCNRAAAIIQEFKPGYLYPRSLSSTLIETAHDQYFFMRHLPSLTDFGETRNEAQIHAFLKSLIYSITE
jgi:AcrR family transcriptional regulator